MRPGDRECVERDRLPGLFDESGDAKKALGVDGEIGREPLAAGARRLDLPDETRARGDELVAHLLELRQFVRTAVVVT